MTSRKPPSQRDPERIAARLGRTVQSMTPGTAGGRVANASPSSYRPRTFVAISSGTGGGGGGALSSQTPAQLGNAHPGFGLAGSREDHVHSSLIDGSPIITRSTGDARYLQLTGGTISGNLGVQGSTSLFTLTTSSTATIGGSATVAGTLGVTGASTFNGDITLTKPSNALLEILTADAGSTATVKLQNVTLSTNKTTSDHLAITGSVTTSGLFRAPAGKFTNDLVVGDSIVSGAVLGALTVGAWGPTVKGIVVRAASEQTASQQEWQDSAGVIRAKVAAGGAFVAGFSTDNTSPAPLAAFHARRGLAGSAGNIGPAFRHDTGSAAFVAGYETGGAYGNTGRITTEGVGLVIGAGSGGVNAFRIVPYYAGGVPVSIDGVTSQTADLTQWRTVAGGVQSGVSADGRFHGPALLQRRVANGVPLQVAQYGTDTSDLTQWTNSGGGVLASVNSNGGFRINAGNTAGSLDTFFNAAGSMELGTTGGQNLRINTFSNGSVFIGAGSTAGLDVVGGHTTLRKGVTALSASSSSLVALVRGAASQTADLQRWENSAATMLARVAADGGIFTNTDVRAEDSVVASFFQDKAKAKAYLSTVEAGYGFVAFNRVLGNIPFAIRAASGQTADLFRVLDPGGTSLGGFNATGGIFTSGTLSATGAATLSSTLGVTGATTLSGTLTVNNTSSLNGRTVVGAGVAEAYTGAGLEIHRNGSTVKPRISFHMGGIVASQVGMASDGTIQVLNNPGTGFEKFAAGSTLLTSTTAFNSADGTTYTLRTSQGAAGDAFDVGADATKVYMQTWGSRPLRINHQGNAIELAQATSVTGTFSVSGASTLTGTVTMQSSATVATTLGVTGVATFSARSVHVLGVEFQNNTYNTAENTYFAWDAGGNQRLGFSKKAGGNPALAYGNSAPFRIVQYGAQASIDPAGVQTDRLTIGTDGLLTAHASSHFVGSMTAASTLTFGPNSNGVFLALGGNGGGPTTTTAAIAASNGNIHYDPRTGAYGNYFGWYSGTSYTGTYFGNGVSGQSARIDRLGNFTLSGTLVGSSTGQFANTLTVTSTSATANDGARLRLHGQSTNPNWSIYNNAGSLRFIRDSDGAEIFQLVPGSGASDGVVVRGTKLHIRRNDGTALFEFNPDVVNPNTNGFGLATFPPQSLSGAAIIEGTLTSRQLSLPAQWLAALAQSAITPDNPTGQVQVLAPGPKGFAVSPATFIAGEIVTDDIWLGRAGMLWAGGPRAESWGYGGTGAAKNAASPPLIDLDALDAPRILWLPGTAGNFVSTPDRNEIDYDSSTFENGVGRWEGLNKNLLTANESSVEGALGYIQSGLYSANVTIARSTAQAFTGTASLALTANAVGSMGQETNSDPVLVPGQVYTATAHYRAASTARRVRMYLWFPSQNVQLFGAWTADHSSGWTQATITAQAPAGATICRVGVQVEGCAAGEVHYVDAVGLFETPNGNLAPGGGDFENGLDGYTTVTAAPLTVSQEQSYTGRSSAKVASAGGAYEGLSAQSFMRPIAGATYTASAWVFCPVAMTLRVNFTKQDNTAASAYTPSIPANTWTRVSRTFTVPDAGQLLALYIDTGTDSAARTFYVDAVQVVVGSQPVDYLPPVTYNLVPNPGVEVNTAQWNGYHDNSASSGRSTVRAYVGPASFVVNRNTVNSNAWGASVWTGGNFGVEGQIVTASAWVYCAAATFVSFIARDDASNDSEAGVFIGSAGTAVPAGTWTRVKATYKVKSNRTVTRVYIVSADTTTLGDYFWVDAVQVEYGSVATPYVDGSLGAGYSWEASENLMTPAQAEGTGGYGGQGAALTFGDTAWSVSGGSSLRVSPNTASADTNATMTGLQLAPNTTYTMSATINVPVAQTGTLDARARRIVLYAAATSAGAITTGFGESVTAAATGVTRLSVTFTTNSTDLWLFARFYNGAASGGGDVLWDAVQLEARSYATPFGQAGTAHASTSRRQTPWVLGGTSLETLFTGANWLSGVEGTRHFQVDVPEGAHAGVLGKEAGAQLRLPVTAGQVYTASGYYGGQGGYAPGLRVRADDGTLLVSGINYGGTARQSFTFTAPASGFIRLQLFRDVTTGIFGQRDSLFLDSVQLERGAGATPYTLPTRITGDLDLRAHVALEDWTGATNQPLVFGDYLLFVTTTGRLAYNHRNTGTTYSTEIVGDVLGFADGSAQHVRVTTALSANGATRTITFYKSSDGATWTACGSGVQSTATTVLTSDRGVRVGSAFAAEGNGTLKGKVLSAEVRAGINGPVVARYDATAHTGATYTDSTGKQWAISRSGDATAEIVDRNTWAFTGTEYLTLPDRDDLTFADNVMVLASSATHRSGNLALFRKGGSAWEYSLGPVGDGAGVSFNTWPISGAAGGVNITTAKLTDGAWHTWVGESPGLTGPAIITQDGTVVAAQEAPRTASMANGADPVRLGQAGGGAGPFFHSGLIQWWAMFRRTLTAAEHAELAEWDGHVVGEPLWLRESAVLYLNASSHTTASEYVASNSLYNLAAKNLPLPSSRLEFKGGGTDPSRGLFAYSLGTQTVRLSADGVFQLRGPGANYLNVEPDRLEFWHGGNRRVFLDGATGSAIFEGTVTATAGAIGGFTINTGQIIGAAGTGNEVGVSGDPSISKAFWAGGTSANANTPFQVTPAGHLTSRSALIGGWTVNAAQILSSRLELSSGGYIAAWQNGIGSGSHAVMDGRGNGSIFYVHNAVLGKRTVDVTAAGNVTIEGAITAISGLIGGFSLDTNQMRASAGTTNEIGVSGSTAIAEAFWAGGAPAAAPFRVTNTGALTASSGVVAGFTISATEGLYSGALTARVHMRPGSGFWAGGEVRDTAPFSVNEAGYLRSSSGVVGAWNIGTQTLSAGAATTRIVLDPLNGIHMGADTLLASPFSVTNAGFLRASSGVIAGWDVTNDRIRKTAANSTLELVNDANGGYLHMINGVTQMYFDARNAIGGTPIHVLKSGVTQFRVTSAGDVTLTGTITAQSVVAGGALQAGTVTASKLSIQSPVDNMMFNGIFESAPAIGTVEGVDNLTGMLRVEGWGRLIGGDGAPDPRYAIAAGAGQPGTTTSGPGKSLGLRNCWVLGPSIPVIPGLNYYWSFRYMSPLAQSGGLYMRIMFYSKPDPTNYNDGLISDNSVAENWGIPAGNTWYNHEGSIVAPAGATHMMHRPHGWSAASHFIYFGDFKFQRQATRVEIADGAVTADRIGTGTLTAERFIQVNGTSSQVFLDGRAAQNPFRVVRNSDSVQTLFADNDGNVTMDGTVRARAGEIGGWSINTTSLSTQPGTGNEVGLSGEGTLATSVAMWAGGTRTGAPFRVTKDGSLTASKGVIGAWRIGTQTLDAGAATTRIVLDPLNGIWAGADTLATTTPFSVTNAGFLRANSGVIGGWTLSATQLTGGATTTAVGLSTSGSYAFWAGAVAADASTPFSVTPGGFLRSTSGLIGGWSIGTTRLTAGVTTSTVGLESSGTYAIWAGEANPTATTPFSVTFAGALNARNGLIGGFTISPTEGLFAGSGATRVQMKPGQGFWAGADARDSAPFRVREDGYLWATNGNIAGSLTVQGRIEVGNHGQAGLDSYVIVRRASDGSWGMIDGRSGNNRFLNTSTGRFWVDLDGRMTASEVNISGAITATSGTFSGTVYANAGTFSGSISAASISSSFINGELTWSSENGFTNRIQRVSGGPGIPDEMHIITDGEINLASSAAVRTSQLYSNSHITSAGTMQADGGVWTRGQSRRRPTGSNQYIGGATWSQIDLPEHNVNDGHGVITQASNYFYITRGGWYHISGEVYFVDYECNTRQIAAIGRHGQAATNGACFARQEHRSHGPAGQRSDGSIQLSRMIHLGAGETVALMAWSQTGANVGSNGGYGNTYLTCVYMGPNW